MPSTVFDSFYFKDRFGTNAMRELWNDRATLQRWLDVEVALAKVEADLGLMPVKAAREIASQARTFWTMTHQNPRLSSRWRNSVLGTISKK